MPLLASHRQTAALLLALLAAAASSGAGATARMGGALSTLASGGQCRFNQLVPLDTLQDSFVLSGGSNCGGQFASVAMHADAASGSLGVGATSQGNGLGSAQASAQVSSIDVWTITVPAGIAIGSIISIPVSFALAGTVSGSALFAAPATSFLNYSFAFGEFGNASGVYQVQGAVASTGASAQTLSGIATFGYRGQPLQASVEMQLAIGKLIEGAADFDHTARATLQLPPGYAAFTSSGVPLVFAPVPEPATWALMALGTAVLLGRRKPA